MRLFGGVLLLFVSSTLAAQEGDGWLNTIAMSAHKSNYSGSFVYKYGSHFEASRIVHFNDATGEHERVQPLDGHDRGFFVRNNREVWRVVEDHTGFRIEPGVNRKSFPDLLPEKVSQISSNYQYKPVGDDKLAGYEASVIDFVPRDALRYGYRMWAEKKTGLLLKSVTLDARSRPVEQYEFTQLDISDDVDRGWVLQSQDIISANGKVVHHKSQPLAKQPSGWVVDGVPAGFRKIADMRRPLPNSKSAAVQMVYADGFAGFSVFIEPHKAEEDEPTGLVTRGAINVYSHQLDEFKVTVVGELPARTVIQIADSVRYTGM